MALSYEYNSTFTRDDAIHKAFELIGEYVPGEDIASEDLSSAASSLTMMLRGWQASGIGIWKNKDVAVFIDGSSTYYDLGPMGAHAAYNYYKSELASAVAIGATTVTLDDVDGIDDTYDRDAICEAQTMSGSGALSIDGVLANDSVGVLPCHKRLCIYSAGDNSSVNFTITGKNWFGDTVSEQIAGPNAGNVYTTKTYKTITSIQTDNATTGDVEAGVVGNFIGIELDDGTMQWSSIVSAISTTLTIADAITGAASVYGHVYTYKDKTQRPLRIIEATNRLNMNTDFQVQIFGREEYKLLAKKTSTGHVNQIYYDRQIRHGRLYVWPVGQDVKEYLLVTARIPIMDLVNTSDNFDIPEEYMEAIVYNLALRIAPIFGAVLDQVIGTLAAQFYEDMRGDDSEDTSVYLNIRARRY